MTKYVVVKIGSGVLLTRRHELDEDRIANLAHQIGTIQKSGVGVAFVISGAVACGMKFINVSYDAHFAKILAAGVGQSILTSMFERVFRSYNIRVAQILLTQKDLQRKGADHLTKILRGYAKMGIVPLINENDVVKLNNFGGNDFLSVEIARLFRKKQTCLFRKKQTCLFRKKQTCLFRKKQTCLFGSSELVILSTMKGSKFSVGGGASKQAAVRKANLLDIHSLVADGKVKDILLKILRPEY